MPRSINYFKIKVRTLCIPGKVCLLSWYSLVLTCVVCLEMKEEQFFSFRARGDEESLASVGKPLVSHLRYASQVLQTRSQYLDAGNYQAFSLIQSSTIALAHSDEPYIYAELWEIRGNPDSMS